MSINIPLEYKEEVKKWDMMEPEELGMYQLHLKKEVGYGVYKYRKLFIGSYYIALCLSFLLIFTLFWFVIISYAKGAADIVEPLPGALRVIFIGLPIFLLQCLYFNWMMRHLPFLRSHCHYGGQR